MINCILINNTEITEIKVKNLTEDTIHKKCNFKSDKDFQLIKSFNYELNKIELWGKIQGQSNLKNDFSYFVNNKLNIYGKCIFIMKSSEKYISLSKDIFTKFLSETENSDETSDKVHHNKITSEIDEDNNNISEDDDSDEEVDSEYSFNSELSYELYEYSDDNAEENSTEGNSTEGNNK